MIISKIKSKLEAILLADNEDANFGTKRNIRRSTKPDAPFISEMIERYPAAMALLFCTWIKSEGIDGITRTITLLKHTDITLLTYLKKFISETNYKNLQISILESAKANNNHDVASEMELYRETVELVKSHYKDDRYLSNIVPFEIFNKLSYLRPEALALLLKDYSVREIAMIMVYLSKETALIFLSIIEEEQSKSVLMLLRKEPLFSAEEYHTLVNKLRIDFGKHS